MNCSMLGKMVGVVEGIIGAMLESSFVDEEPSTAEVSTFPAAIA
jgi:hypothetical protein